MSIKEINIRKRPPDPLLVFHLRIPDDQKKSLAAFKPDALLFTELFSRFTGLYKRMYRTKHAGAETKRFGSMHGISTGDDGVGGIGVRGTVEIESQWGIVHNYVFTFFHRSDIGFDQWFDEIPEHFAIFLAVK